MEEGFTSCISAPDGLIRTGRDHGNEMKDETAIQLRLDQELNLGPIGFQAQSTNTELGPSLVFVADVVVFICLFNSCLT